MLDYSAISEIGLKREKNQDSYCTIKNKNGDLLLMVCDGIGGGKAGEVASGETVKYFIETFKECGIDPDFYTSRRREYDEIMPWEHLDYGVSKSFLISENKAAHAGVTTPNCREKCSACGAACYGEGVCFEKR